MAFMRTIFIYKRKEPLSICSLPTVIIKSYTNNIYNGLWQFMESTVIRTVFIRSIIVYIKKSTLTANPYLFLSLMPIM